MKNVDRKGKLLLKGPVSEITERCFLPSKGLLLLKYIIKRNCTNHFFSFLLLLLFSSSCKLAAPHKAWQMYYIVFMRFQRFPCKQGYFRERFRKLSASKIGRRRVTGA